MLSETGKMMLKNREPLQKPYLSLRKLLDGYLQLEVESSRGGSFYE